MFDDLKIDHRKGLWNNNPSSVKTLFHRTIVEVAFVVELAKKKKKQVDLKSW